MLGNNWNLSSISSNNEDGDARNQLKVQSAKTVKARQRLLPLVVVVVKVVLLLLLEVEVALAPRRRKVAEELNQKWQPITARSH